MMYKDFRRQFRVPYEMFQTILTDARASKIFSDETTKKPGPKPIALGVKIMACLRFMAIGASFKALELES